MAIKPEKHHFTIDRPARRLLWRHMSMTGG
jgi:hypothetical protein